MGDAREKEGTIERECIELSEEERVMLSMAERCLRIAEDYLLTENSSM